MQVNELGRDVIVFFKRIHQQYACLPAVAATLGASANIERDERMEKLSAPIRNERLIPSNDTSIGVMQDIIEVSDTHCICDATPKREEDIPSERHRLIEQRRQHTPFYRGLFPVDRGRTRR